MCDTFPKPGAYKIMGVACVRCVLMVVKKEKLGKEGTVYTLDETKNMFESDIRLPSFKLLHLQSLTPRMLVTKPSAWMIPKIQCFWSRRPWAYSQQLPTQSRTLGAEFGHWIGCSQIVFIWCTTPFWSLPRRSMWRDPGQGEINKDKTPSSFE